MAGPSKSVDWAVLVRKAWAHIDEVLEALFCATLAKYEAGTSSEW